MTLRHAQGHSEFIESMNNIAAVVLAAGKGKRMKSKEVNKVVLPLGNKQMILHTMDLLDKLNIKRKIVVVGFAKKSVMDILKDRVVYVEQKKRLGTAHAVRCGLRALNTYSSSDQAKPESREVSSENSSRQARTVTRHAQRVDDVLVLNGDDSAFYKKETIKSLVERHKEKNSSFTFLTIELDNPTGLGRVIRNEMGKVTSIVEEKDASKEQKRIKEINPACYIFRVDFLRKYLGKIKKSLKTGEYYLTKLVDLAIENKEKIETLNSGRISWRGINTMEELKEAERLFFERSHVNDGAKSRSFLH